MNRREVRFSGFGGQGVVLSGIIIGRAAALHEGKHSVQTQSYGAEARGGAAMSEVVSPNRRASAGRTRRLMVGPV